MNQLESFNDIDRVIYDFKHSMNIVLQHRSNKPSRMFRTSREWYKLHSLHTDQLSVTDYGTSFRYQYQQRFFHSSVAYLDGPFLIADTYLPLRRDFQTLYLFSSKLELIDVLILTQTVRYQSSNLQLCRLAEPTSFFYTINCEAVHFAGITQCGKIQVVKTHKDFTGFPPTPVDFEQVLSFLHLFFSIEEHLTLVRTPALIGDLCDRQTVSSVQEALEYLQLTAALGCRALYYTRGFYTTKTQPSLLNFFIDSTAQFQKFKYYLELDFDVPFALLRETDFGQRHSSRLKVSASGNSRFQGRYTLTDRDYSELQALNILFPFQNNALSTIPGFQTLYKTATLTRDQVEIDV